MTQGGKAPVELETRKISTLLKEYAVPGIIAMTASSLYNMVDSIYIGHIKDVGSLAISGLAVTFPIMNLGSAIGTLVGVGASTLVSMLLGQKNYVTANKVLPNVVTLNVVLGEGTAQCGYAERSPRRPVLGTDPGFSETGAVLFRSKRSHLSLCQGLHDHHPCRIHHHPPVFRPEQHDTRNRQSKAGNGAYAVHSDSERHP